MAETKQNLSESFSQMVKLHEAEEPWKPSFKQKISGDLDQALLVEENIKRNVLSVLNKITPQKYDKLLGQLKMLDIDTENKLDILINLMYERAAYEPLYSVIYAKMYKDIVLDKKTIEVKEDKIEKKIEFSHQFGNMKFVGELFKQNMISEAFLHYFIKHLFSLSDEKSLACLCQLLKTIGKDLDQKKDESTRKSMERYFSQMQKIVDNRSTSTRIRFMLQDVIDLKKNNWIPRRIENYPKTIDKIRLEVAIEQEKSLDNCKKKKKTKSELLLKCAELNEDQLKLKSKLLIGEYLYSNFELLIKSVTECFSSSTVNIFLKVALDQVLEQSSRARNLIGQLFFCLLKQKVITVEQFQEGLSCTLEIGKETKGDNVPFNWNHIAEILQPMLEDETYSLTVLKDLLSPCIPSKTAGKIVSIILHNIAKEKGNLIVKQQWEQSKLKWTDFLGDGIDVDEFIRQHKLEFVIDYPIKGINTVLPGEVSKVRDKSIKKPAFEAKMQTVDNTISPDIKNKQNTPSLQEAYRVFPQVLAQPYYQSAECYNRHVSSVALLAEINRLDTFVHRVFRKQLQWMELRNTLPCNTQLQHETLRMRTQSAQQMPIGIHTQQNTRTKKVLKIIDPKTGKNILEDMKVEKKNVHLISNEETKHAFGATMQTVDSTASSDVNKQNTIYPQAFYQVPAQQYHQAAGFSNFHPPILSHQIRPNCMTMQANTNQGRLQAPLQCFNDKNGQMKKVPRNATDESQRRYQRFQKKKEAKREKKKIAKQMREMTRKTNDLLLNTEGNAGQNINPESHNQANVGANDIHSSNKALDKGQEVIIKMKKSRHNRGKGKKIAEQVPITIASSVTCAIVESDQAPPIALSKDQGQTVIIERRIQYEREILLKLRYHLLSTALPSYLENSDILVGTKKTCPICFQAFSCQAILEAHIRKPKKAHSSLNEKKGKKKNIEIKETGKTNFMLNEEGNAGQSINPQSHVQADVGTNDRHSEKDTVAKGQEVIIKMKKNGNGGKGKKNVAEVSSTIALSVSCDPVDNRQSSSIDLSTDSCQAVNILRIKYGRDILLQLQTHPLSTVLPSYLLNSDILVGRKKTCPICFQDFSCQAILEAHITKNRKTHPSLYKIRKAKGEKKIVEIKETKTTKDLLMNKEIVVEVPTTIASSVSCASIDNHQSPSTALSKDVCQTVNIERIQYSRDILLQLQTHPLSTILPSYLENSGVILKKIYRRKKKKNEVKIEDMNDLPKT